MKIISLIVIATASFTFATSQMVIYKNTGDTLRVPVTAVDSIRFENQIPTDGLIAYYPFSGTAQDQSGNSLNGTIHGAILSNDRHGNSNTAYSFDGMNSSIEVANSPIFDVQQLSVSTWINPSASTNTLRIVTKSDGLDGASDRTFELHLTYSKGNYHLSTEVFRDGGTYFWGVGAKDIPITQWTHVALVISSDKIITYVNGVEDLVLERQGLLRTSTQPLRFGQVGTNNAATFNGSIDDTRIYNRALTADEILTLSKE